MMGHPVTWVLAVGLLLGLVVVIAGAALMFRGTRTQRRTLRRRDE
jgi:uncharacterized membrane protein HdeD (DUF308 family)